ncbi:LuxR C-terminal-related transcriptional regulator [Paenibacillus campi]|uniref:LuxR C-terminal-related transcriptional regulator n=1 Tax=Paenibacillus campi TaxID=3106031 RepID=UPI002AFED2A7|nr:LuxR C-terminal-related transcriptional regulator [Paenibacillus sp. SGZ-1014]
MDNLTQREQQVWREVVVKGRKMVDVAGELHISPIRVKNLRNSALAKMCKP